MDEATMLKNRGYKIGKHLGEGSYAKVRSAYSEHLKLDVAIKVIDRKKTPADFIEKFLPREIEISKLMKHHSVVKIYEIFETPDGKVYIIMELGVHGDLLDFIKAKGALSEDLAHRMFYQLVSAVKYCHDLDIVHRDLKCENLLLDKDFNIKLSDFGFARRVARNNSGKITLSKTFCGSPAYAAPEILQGIPYQPKVYDIWSLGVILYIMVCGVMPYDDSNIKRMLRIQKEHRLQFPHSKHISSKCKELIYGMLEPDATLRLTADQILNHGWIQLIQKPKGQKANNIDKTLTSGANTEVKEGKKQDKINSKSEDEELLPKEKPLQQEIASTALDMAVEHGIPKNKPEHIQKATM